MLIGLVGKPSSGKSTFFKALTLAEVAIAPYPFTTLTANQGIGFVKTNCVESELKLKCKPKYGFCISAKRFVPVKLVDVAGLVPGAHAGKGRGNQFLDDLREADVLVHVLDVSGRTDEQGNQTTGYDPCFDVRFLQEEIELWLYGIIGKNWKTFSRKVQAEGKKLSEELTRQLTGLKISEDVVISTMRRLNLSESPTEWSDENLLSFTRELRKLSKPMIIAANKSDLPEAEKNLKKLKEEFPDEIIIPCSAESELALREAAKHGLIDYVPGECEFKAKKELSPEQNKGLEFVKEKILNKFSSTGVQECLNYAVFDLLKRIVVYPVENENKFSDKNGNILPDAKLMPESSTALDLAYTVHSTIGENFLAAIDSRTGKRLGKDYKLKNKDIIRIMVK